MLRTRLWMGAVLIVLVVGVLLVDERLGPWYPFLLLLLLALSLVACFELLHLLGPRRPPSWFCYLAVVAVILANWVSALNPSLDPWLWIMGVFAAVVLGAFLVEMATFREPGESVTRIALTVWLTAYLGLLPCFLAQLCWPERNTTKLALVIFVPKCCDIGAYFTGRFLGRHRMTPTLSPKKTWEGLIGGLVVAVAVAIAINRLGSRLTDLEAAGFGLTVGIAGVLGDLAESLIKRDCRRKDASHALPGFGGVLDVVDAVLFAAPVAYWWLK